MEHTANTILQHVVDWGKQNELKFAPHKTKFDLPSLYMSGSQINLVNQTPESDH